MNDRFGQTLSENFADRIISIDVRKTPAPVLEISKRFIADTVAVMLAGSSEEVTKNVAKIADTEGGECGLVGRALTTSAAFAALVNGTSAHAHDFDDNNFAMIGHASAPVVPAILALADEYHVTGQEFIDAYIAGVEVESKMGRVASFDHNNRGWHTTSTLGTFGATAACCKILKLEKTQIVNAIGIAASMSSGIRQNFGSMTKPLHAGIAAMNGVLSAKLALAGVTSSSVAIEGHEGFLELLAIKDQEIISTLDWESYEVLENVQKLYACCSLVHPLLDVVVDKLPAERHGRSIRKINCSVSGHALNIMRYTMPKDHLEARFSIPYCVAASIVHGSLGPDQFSESALKGNEVLELLCNVKVSIAPGMEYGDGFDQLYLSGEAKDLIRIEYTDGTASEYSTTYAKGDPRNPASESERQEKFFTCVSPVIGAEKSEQLWTELMNLDKMPIVQSKLAV